MFPILSLEVRSLRYAIGQERKSLKGEIPEEFSMSAVDMSMIDHIPDMIEMEWTASRLKVGWSPFTMSLP